MPPTSPTPTEDPHLEPTRPEEADVASGSGSSLRVSAEAEPENADPDRPISFVPHIRVQNTARLHPIRIRTGRYGDLDEHELVTLLDTLEDERARARFRESVYISVFVWIAIALTALFGPKYLWHAPKVVLPSDVLRERELTTLTAPTLSAPRLRPSAPPSVDNRTLEHLRATAPKVPPPPTPAPTPRPEATTPQPSTAAPRPLPSAPAPNLAPSTAPPNLPSSPAPAAVQPRTPPPVVADAPRPQPTTRPNFNGVPQSAADSIQQAIHSATRGGNGGGAISSNRGGTSAGMGGVEVLSDMQGVNFDAYLQRIKREIYDQWIPLLPEEARPPLRKSGVTQIRFVILPDGNIGAMHLDGSTHDDALNRAAWGSILGVGQFPPLPSQFHGPNLELRFSFFVNEDIQ
jgi:outer membrane biosynthesis protein TonB